METFRKTASTDRLDFLLQGVDLGADRVNFLLKNGAVLLDGLTFRSGCFKLASKGYLFLPGEFAAGLDAFKLGRIVGCGCGVAFVGCLGELGEQLADAGTIGGRPGLQAFLPALDPRSLPPG